MANELFVSHPTGNTVYAVIRGSNDRIGGTYVGQFWNTATGAFEAFNAANWANYATMMTELGTSGFFVADMPAGITGLDHVDKIEVYYFAEVAPPALADTDTKVAGVLMQMINGWESVDSLAV